MRGGSARLTPQVRIVFQGRGAATNATISLLLQLSGLPEKASAPASQHANENERRQRGGRHGHRGGRGGSYGHSDRREDHRDGCHKPSPTAGEAEPASGSSRL